MADFDDNGNGKKELKAERFLLLEQKMSEHDWSYNLTPDMHEWHKGDQERRELLGLFVSLKPNERKWYLLQVPSSELARFVDQLEKFEAYWRGQEDA